MSTYPALARLESLSLRGMKLGLAAIDSLCERLGRPEEKVPAVLIGGTNGKGSTAAILSAIASASGLRAGLFTSPHLHRVTERIRVGERDVEEEELDRALEQVFRAAQPPPEIPATYFEALTAAAFTIFAGQGLELAVLEVGLGGRLDATNVAPALLSAVTSLDFDHTEDLGPTLESIAREKAGIFRRGRCALVRTGRGKALETFRDCAAAVGALFHDVASETSVSVESVGLEGTRFRLETPERSYSLFTPLPGAHQAGNAAVAVRASELLSSEFSGITPVSIEKGVRSVRWPGRLESHSLRGKLLLLDGCHNPEGASALARFLEQVGLAGQGHLVFGAMADKDIEGIAARLFPLVQSVSFVAASTERAAKPSELARRVSSLAPEAKLDGNLQVALLRLLASPGTAPIIVAGSLYLVGEARALTLSGALEERGT